MEWAGVLGSPQDFTANWSYTALSRAREPTEIYLIAGEDRFAGERAEIAPAEQERWSPLRRMATSIRVRDDADLALDWIEPPEVPAVEPLAHPVELTPHDREAAPFMDLRRAPAEHRRERHVRAALESPGPHLESALGAPPRQGSARDAWEQAATAIERYRLDHKVRGRDPLGARPAGHEARLAYHRARREIERANRRLCRETSRSIGLEL